MAAFHIEGGEDARVLAEALNSVVKMHQEARMKIFTEDPDQANFHYCREQKYSAWVHHLNTLIRK